MQVNPSVLKICYQPEVKENFILMINNNKMDGGKSIPWTWIMV